ncbi:MAG: tRNA pseudouridine(55) synthase TruB [Candidatus Aminicenantes bacterium]|nr:tRNA pseudouridine(55) synthase TruB [Candidatus Aminicenantes bacterium]
MGEKTGIILVNKKRGMTSHDVVDSIRKILHQRKVGHMGTLDPQAEGLLILGLGKATRLFPYIVRGNKLYTGRIRLGVETDTYDIDGKVIEERDISGITEEKIKEVAKEFLGRINQMPPPFSAKKIKGRRMYELARKGEKVKAKPVEVEIHFFSILSYEPPIVNFEMKCSAGTYVRSIAHDLGQKLGVGGTLEYLKRLKSGEFSIEDAHTLEEIKEAARKGEIDELIIPLNKVLSELPIVYLREQGVQRAKHGNFIPLKMVGGKEGGKRNDFFRLMDYRSNFIGIGKPVKFEGELGIKPVIVINGE